MFKDYALTTICPGAAYTFGCVQLEDLRIATYTMSEPIQTKTAETTNTTGPTDAVSSPTTATATVPEATRDGKGYIDEVTPEEADPVAEVEAAEAASDDGSSVTEESDAGSDFRFRDEDEYKSGIVASDDESDHMEWGVEDEDWELADGDFTKQYNRVRQSYAASSSTSAELPLPARNAAAAKRRLQGTPNKSALNASKALVDPAILAGVAANPKSASERANQKDKADRATHEQVLDARTRLVLTSLVNRGYFGQIHGCVSTGKEANVYLAYASEFDLPANAPRPYPERIAVKIYRTSILNFRARQNYIVGDFRLQGGYAKAKNPRKMVKLWAEKELRNLKRLKAGGVRCPVVIEQRENVLVMEYLGNGDEASPRLKDADITSVSKLSRLYGELLIAMRRLYQTCHLVHADLSEYNILYHANHLYIIDVSQSVEHEHPSAFDFLRLDIKNVEDFFKKKAGGAVRTLGLRRTWNFITQEEIPGITPAEEKDEKHFDEAEARLLDILKDWLDEEDEADAEEPEASTSENKDGYAAEGSSSAAAEGSEPPKPKKKTKAEQQVDDNVFFSSYIPRTLGEVYDPERDIDILKQGGGDQLIYADIAKLDLNAAKPQGPAQVSEETEEESQPEAAEVAETPADASEAPTDTPAKKKSVRWEDEANEDEEGEEEEQEEEEFEKKPRGFRHEDKDAKRERKKALKEEMREKRKNKMPKAEKQRLIKKSGGR